MRAITAACEYTHSLPAWILVEVEKDTGTPRGTLGGPTHVLDDLQQEKRMKVEGGGFIQGRVAVGEKPLIREKSTVQGRSIVGRAAKIESGICAVPYIRICNHVTVNRRDTKDSLIMD